ncbi:cation:proton antiporter [uncultured Sanguibacteroides sp.]|uniref:cation:proton antiporter domain-containing protein n=1 Tax=uncultured Sanguibacteroides sp. TaxID=1635151 RepID=UPI0025D716F5|nr:cation:proton antiporter [uncultured Sanguibacteroides sp.]
MSHVPVLISDLAIILFSAGLITIIFKWLKQPVVLGYIVAGLIAGPYTFGGPLVTDTEDIQIWADIGVIFLLFALGLDFSFKKLMNVGGTAMIGALTVVGGMMTLGYVVGMFLGWGHMNSLFLGGMLSMSSTTIIFKAFDDMGLSNQRFAGVVFGILVVEDLFAVVLMVLLSTLAVSKHFEGMEMIDSILKLSAFLLFWSITGIFLIPTLLKKVRQWLNSETLLVVALGLCLGMVMLAVQAGFSSALGAFVMGSILAETIEAENIEHLIKPVKDLFGAIFFVSVGMMIDPAMLLEYWFPILLITLTVMIGQIACATSGVLLSGQTLKVAVQSGFSLAQIGEFAFIIASLGISLKVTDHFLYPIVVAVSVITTFFTPYMIRIAEPTYRFLNTHLPASWIHLLERYSSGTNTIRHKNTWRQLLKALFRIVITYTVLSIFLIAIFLQYVTPFIREKIPGIQGSIISAVLILLVISPFLRAIMMKKNHSLEFQQLWNDNKYNRGPLISLIVLRIALCIWIVMFVISKLINVASGLLIAIASVTILLFIFSKRLKKHSILLERRFLRNFTARQQEEERKSPIKQRFVRHLLSKDLHLAEFEVAQTSPSVGKSLKELNFRQTCGVSVVTILRGEERINIPGGEEILYPFDHLIVAATDNEIEIFRKFVENRVQQREKEIKEKNTEEVSLEQFIIEKGATLIGRSIRESGIRDKEACLVIGIERGSTSIMNPSPATVFEEGDIVWIVGEHQKLLRLAEGKTIN